MGLIHKTHNAWHTAKAVGISYVLSLVAGWLTRMMIQGTISAENKAALFILLATIVTIVVILCTVGIRRWKRGELQPMEKRLMVFSLVMYVVCFVVGWYADFK